MSPELFSSWKLALYFCKYCRNIRRVQNSIHTGNLLFIMANTERISGWVQNSFHLENLLFIFANIARIFAMSPEFFLGSQASNLRVLRLWKDPKAMATTVQARQITLYGILKSGVASETSKVSVCSRMKTSFSISSDLAVLKIITQCCFYKIQFLINSIIQLKGLCYAILASF